MNKLILAIMGFYFYTAGLTLDVPNSVKIAIQPEDVLEMEVIRRPLSVYVADSKGKLITVLGGGIWNCEVSILSGPGILLGTTSVSFVNGSATFPNLYITQEGSGYVLQFEVTYPTTANMSAVNSTSFEVGARPLGIQLEENPNMRAGNTNFAVRGTIWDEALDQAADDEVLGGLSWECDLMLADRKMMVVGNTRYDVTMGNGSIVFEDVKIPQPGRNQALRVECFSPEYFAKPIISVQSDPFTVYNYPDTGLLRKTFAEVNFEGPYELVEDTIVAFNSLGLYGVATCLDCPPGVLPKPKEEKGVAQPSPLLAEWDPCTAPIFLNPDLSCQVDRSDRADRSDQT